jgi:hypothetical protein
VRRVAALAALAALAVTAVLAAAPAATAATHECNGLMVCVPVAGPWVVVQTSLPQPTEYQLACPRGYIVGGLDAELSSRDVDVSFPGMLGSPVNPGITTSNAAVFSLRYVGTDPGAAPSVRPHLGCIPASGGGGRVPTSVTAAAAVFPPGRPVTRRVKEIAVPVGNTRTAQGCLAGERLLGGSYAVGFFTPQPPAPRLARGVRATRTIRGTRVLVAAKTTLDAGRLRPTLQVSALCAGGK